MPATRYLKNAWAKKEAQGEYWLFIQGGDLQATFRLDPGEEEDSIPRRALDAWLAEQDSTNGETNKPEDDFQIGSNDFLRNFWEVFEDF
jgi:hypothetical protein